MAALAWIYQSTKNFGHPSLNTSYGLFKTGQKHNTIPWFTTAISDS